MKKQPICRTALFMPASSERAVEKGPQLPADAIILDLEDSVATGQKQQARDAAIKAFRTLDYNYRLRALRINDAGTEWHTADVAAAASCQPDVIVLPKVDSEIDIARFCALASREESLRNTSVWAMLESPMAVLNVNRIAQSKSDYPALSALLVGNNDIARVAKMPDQSDRTYLIPWLMNIVAAARSNDLMLLDGVYNEFADLQGLRDECEQARLMGMDGKLTIHPTQLSIANTAFSPAQEALARARVIVDRFSEPGNEEKGAISIDGRMVERLHLNIARELLDRAVRLSERD
jgi:citrate lyase subunit beta/citryl-CoA lyase